MSDLPPGVTRYPAEDSRVPRRGAGAAAGLFGIVLVVLAVVALVQGASVLSVVVVALVAVAVVPASIVLPVPRLRVPLSVVVALAAYFALAGSGAANVFLLGVAVSGLVTGRCLLSLVERRRWWQRRLRLAEGAPPAGLDPRGGKDVGLLAWWADVDHQYEMVDPTPDVVLAALRELDGHRRSVVSVYRGTGRLDVGGSASGAMVVQQSDDRAHWFQVVARHDRPDGQEAVGVVLAGAVLGLVRARTTDRETAERAVRTWLADGVRDPDLAWERHSAWGPRLALRPAWLRSTD